MTRPLPTLPFRALALPVLLLGACSVSVPAFSTDPAPDRLVFPAGAAVDPSGRLLYVSNGNADLRYGGGTLMAFDLERFECALDAFWGLPVDPACAAYPSASDIALTRDSESKLPTAGCVKDPVDPQVMDCSEKPFALSNATVRVGNFAGTIRVRKTGDATRTLYLAVRGDPSVTFADVDLGKLSATADAGGHIERPGFIDCFDDDAALLTREGYDAATNTTSIAPRCDKNHLVQTYKCDGDYGCLENQDDDAEENGNNDIPSEPFNLLFEEGTKPSGEAYAHLLVGHLSAGSVTLIDVRRPEISPGVRQLPSVLDVSAPFFPADQGDRHGTFGIGRRSDPVAPLYYLTSSLTSAISTFSLEDRTLPAFRDQPARQTTSVVPGIVFSTGGAFASGSDGREILFDPNNDRAYISQNAPPSLAVLDTRLDQPQGRGLPANKVVDTVPICQGASHMGMRQASEAGPAGAEAALRTRLYAVCFSSNQLMVVDPDRAAVDETILVGRGPTEIAFNFSGEETPPAERLPEPRRRRAYVTMYSESTIGIIDLTPGSPTENRLIGRLGFPTKPNL